MGPGTYLLVRSSPSTQSPIERPTSDCLMVYCPPPPRYPPPTPPCLAESHTDTEYAFYSPCGSKSFRRMSEPVPGIPDPWNWPGFHEEEISPTASPITSPISDSPNGSPSFYERIIRDLQKELQMRERGDRTRTEKIRGGLTMAGIRLRVKVYSARKSLRRHSNIILR
ncbi:hypothetical protein HGRIS_000787 [Hohenbuehelia grisea]|uniref:Uncharacterized protein n=1 Tax=Hohenbuehelia grisea TaxID=104357 RepID=A0ABR3IPQ6_9AGAR